MTDSSFASLLDNYAMNGMLALMQVYAPEEWPEDDQKAKKWCNWISKCSYFMALSMMTARHELHSALTEECQKGQEDADA